MPNQFFSDELGDLENYFVTDYWLIDQYIGDQLWGWGRNTEGQLGVNESGSTTSRSTPVTTILGGSNWKSVSCGKQHTIAIKTDGTLWVCGQNTEGQLGINDTTIRSTPVTTILGGTNWKSVSSGGYHTVAIKTDGTLWTWGRNSTGNLGINGYGIRTTPVTTFLGGTNWKSVAGGLGHTAAIKTDGTLWVWGDNNSLALGINASGNRLTPVTTFLGGTDWKLVSAGGSNTSTIKTDGTLWVWGSNNAGQLGVNDSTTRSTPVTTILGGTNWKLVSAGGSNTSTIKTDGTLWIWGSNGYGQLGVNDTTPRSTPVTTFLGGSNWKYIAAGGNNSTAAIKTDGTLWNWGDNLNGQLGVNDRTTRSTPVTTRLGGTNWKQIAAGQNHMVAITSGLTLDLS